MIKSILIAATLQTFLFCGEQIILVVSEDFNSSIASLECYEDGKKVCGTLRVSIGEKGLGWGLGEVALTQRAHEPLKKEGDKKAPAGVFKLSDVFGYAGNSSLHMPYLHASKELICVDDVNSSLYNQILHMPKKEPKSFERMKREDHQYERGIVVAHNKNGIQGAGSCIFIHVQKTKDAPTAGCTAMTLQEIEQISSWLQKSKNPILVQIPRSSAKEVQKHFPQLKNATLLQ